jgi:hypothetical protein
MNNSLPKNKKENSTYLMFPYFCDTHTRSNHYFNRKNKNDRKLLVYKSFHGV